MNIKFKFLIPVLLLILIFVPASFSTDWDIGGRCQVTIFNGSLNTQVCGANQGFYLYNATTNSFSCRTFAGGPGGSQWNISASKWLYNNSNTLEWNETLGNLTYFSTNGGTINGNVTVTGNVSANYFFGDGSLLTGVSGTGGQWNITTSKWMINDSDILEWNETLGNLTYTRSIENIVTVGKSGADFTTIQEAYDSITDASSTKRYAVKVACGDYAENLIINKSFIYIVGEETVCTYLNATSGTVYNASGSFVSGLFEFTIDYDGGTLTKDEDIMYFDGGFHSVSDVRIIGEKESGDYVLHAAHVDGGVITFNSFRPEMTYNSSVAGSIKIQTLIQIDGNGDVKIENGNLRATNYDTNDAIVGAGISAGSQGKLRVLKSDWALDQYADQISTCYYNLGNTSEIRFFYSQCDVDAFGNGDLYQGYLDSSTNSHTMFSRFSFADLSTTGSGTRYGFFVGAGDTIDSYMDRLLVDKPTNGAGSYMTVSATDGTFRVTNNVTIDQNLTVKGKIVNDGTTLRPLIEKNSKIAGPAYGIYMTGPSGQNLPHFILQSGGANQASTFLRSVMIADEIAGFHNTSNATDCVAYMNQIGETLQIDCNTTTTGADLLVSDDMQIVDEVWVKDREGEWHFLTREMTELDNTNKNLVYGTHDKLVDASLFFNITATGGENIEVNLNGTNTIKTVSTEKVQLLNGTTSSPASNYVYYQTPSNPTLTRNAAYPTGVIHSDVARFIIGTASPLNYYLYSTNTYTNDEILYRLNDWREDAGTTYVSGFEVTADANYLKLATGDYWDALNEIETTNTVNHTLDGFFIIEDDSTYQQYNAFDSITEYNDGGAIGVNKYFNIVCGVIQNGPTTVRMLCIPQNTPGTEYTTVSAAETDASSVTTFATNNAEINKHFLPLVRIITNSNNGNLFQFTNGDYYKSVVGLAEAGSAAGGTNDHSLLTNLNWASAGHTMDTTLNMNTNAISGVTTLTANAVNTGTLAVTTAPAACTGSNRMTYWNGSHSLCASTVTSVAAGNGMDFTTITTTGSVTMGTPSTITDSSTNSVTTTSHTHLIDEASTGQRGIVQLEDSVASTSTTTAATPNSVKTAYDLANTKIGGSGTDGYISKFNGVSSINESVIFQLGSKIGINTQNPLSVLHVVDGVGPLLIVGDSVSNATTGGVSIGAGIENNALNTMVVGDNVFVDSSATNSFSVGKNVDVLAKETFGAGANTVLNGSQCVAMGERAECQGLRSYVFGRSNIASGDYSYSFGNLGLATGDGTFLFSSGAGGATCSGTDVVCFMNNNVGINTQNAQRKLHINDTMRLEPISTAPTSPSAGDIYYDSDTNELCIYNSTAWVGALYQRTCV